MRLISTSAARLRPMYCDRIPSGKRSSAPAKTGIDSISPFWLPVRCSSSAMKGAIAALSTQIMKQKSKYSRAVSSVGR